MATVLVAMSGGVDSSVAAALLLRAGHDVVGVFMRNGVKPAAAAAPKKGGACAPAAPDPSSKASTSHRYSRPSWFDGLSIRCYPTRR